MFFRIMTVLLAMSVVFSGLTAHAADDDYDYKEKIEFKDVKLNKANGDGTITKTILCEIISKSREREDFTISLMVDGSEKYSCTCIEAKSWFLSLNKVFNTPYDCDCGSNTPYKLAHYKWLKINSRRIACSDFIYGLFDVHISADLPP